MDRNIEIEGLRIERVDASADKLLGNLFEHYLHDMAEWFGFDTQADGSYSYRTQGIWEGGIDVFIASSSSSSSHAQEAKEERTVPVGFALVGSAEHWTGDRAVRDVEEFFVIRRHRRAGVGQAFARYLWDQHPGRWLVRVFQHNRPALPFWRTVIAGYTGGQYREEVRTVEGHPWSYFTFDTSSKRVVDDRA